MMRSLSISAAERFLRMRGKTLDDVDRVRRRIAGRAYPAPARIAENR
jgi:hypothetical protein